MKVRKGSSSYWILLSLEKAAEAGLFEAFSYSSQMKYFKELSGIKKQVKKSSLHQTIRRLRIDGLIEQDKSDEGKIILKLTSAGSEMLGAHEIWDGKYRIVIWDIPESKRRIRNLFRRKLKAWQFKSLQKSVWISKRNVTVPLRSFISELGIEKWVLVIESEDPTLSYIDVDDRR